MRPKLPYAMFITVLIFTLFLPETVVGLEGMIVYGEGTVTTPRYRIFNADAGTWGAENSAADLGATATINWAVVKAAPTRDEWALVTQDANLDIKVQLNRSHGGTPCWGDGTTCNAVRTLTLAAPGANIRGFDVEYESVTGDLVIVYSDGTAIPKYVTWDGTSWSAEQSLGGGGVGVVEYIELSSRPSTDTIGLTFSGAADDLNSSIWTGTSWGFSPLTLHETTLPTLDFKEFDAAFTANGNYTVVWGRAAVADVFFRIFNVTAGTWTAVTTYAGHNEVADVGIDVSEDISSADLIITEDVNSASDQDSGALEGNTPTQKAVGCVDASLVAEAAPNKMGAAGYTGASTREGVIVYADSLGSTVDMCTFDTGANAWTAQDLTPSPALGLEKNIDIFSYKNNSHILILIGDANSDLWAKVYNGVGNTLKDTEGGAALELSLSSLNIMSFYFDFKRFVPPAVTTFRFNLTAAITLTDAAPKLLSFDRKLTETLDLTEPSGRVAGFTKRSGDALDITDSILTPLFTRVKLVTDTLDTTDSISTVLFTRVRLIGDALDLTDAITRLVSFTRSLANAMDITEAITSALGRFRQTGQALDITDSILTPLFTRVKLVTDTLDITDSISTVLFTRVRLIGDTIDLTETTTRLFSLTRLFTNAIDLIESGLRISAAQAISQLVGQALDITEAITSALGRFREAAQALDLTDALTSALGRFRQLSQSLDITDAVTSALGRFRQVGQALDITDNISTVLFTRVKLIGDALDITEAVTRLLSFTRSLTNAIDLTEAITSTLGRFRATGQALDITDSIITPLFTRVRLVADALDLTESTTKIASFIRSLTNSIDLTDAITSSLGRFRQATQALDITDNIQNLFTRVRLITDALDITESPLRLFTFLRSLTNAIDLTDAITSTLGRFRQATQSLDLTDAITSALGRFRQVADTLDITDNITTPLFTRVRLIGQALDLTEAIARLLSFIRLFTNAIDLTEVGTVDAGEKFSRTVSDTLDITDAITSALGRFRQVADTLDITDNIITPLFTRVRLLADTIDLTEAITRLASFTRSLTNAIDLTDAITSALGRFRQTGQALDLTDNIPTVLFTRVRLVADALDLTEAVTRLASFTRSLTNAIDLTEAITSALGRFRQLSQSLDITDDIITPVLTRLRLATNAIDLTETITKIFSPLRQLTDTLDITDNISTVLFTRVKLIGDALDITEAITSALGRFRQAAQALDITESITTPLFTRVKLIGDALDITEAITRLASFTRSLTDVIDLTDSITSTLGRFRQTGQALDITENIITTTLKGFVRTVGQALDLSDNIQTTLTRIRFLVNAIDLTDAITGLASFIRSLTNAIDLTDAITSNIVRLRIVTQATDIADAITSTLGRFRQATQALDITDTITRLLSFTRSITNSIDLTDSATRLLSFTRLFANAIDITDTAVRLSSLQRLLIQAFDISDLPSKISSFQRITSLQFLVTAVTGQSFKTVSATFTIPTASVPQGTFVEFDINVKNTGNENLNVSTGVEVYNSTNLVTTINSTNVSLSTGQSKTIITFLNTANLPAGNYRAEGRVLFDGRATVNMTKLFNITSAANIQIGNYTNTSISFTANIPTLITANTSASTWVNMSIVLNSTQEGALAIAEFSSVENQTISGQIKLGKFTDIVASPNITNNLRWYLLNISYIDAEITSSGVDESSLRIWFYNKTTSTWQQETITGVNTSANYVFANVTRFGLFGLYSPSVAPVTPPAPVAPAAAPAPLAPGVIPLPTVKIEFVKWSVLREVMSGQSIVEGIKVRNKNVSTLTDLQVKVSGVPTDWVSVFPTAITLHTEETKAFNLVISVPKGVDVGDYKLLVTLKNDKVEDSTFMILRVKDYVPTYDKPIVIRTILLDYEKDKTKVTLDVNNPLKYYRLVEVHEEIPKSLAQSARDIEFTPYPDEIIREDPLVQWNLKDLVINDTRTMLYLTKGILDEFTGYIYFPLKELIIVETRLPTGLKLADISISPLFAGKASIGKITVENIGDVAKKLEFSMQLPSGWKTEPGKIEATIAAHERKEFKFSIVVPEDAAPGDYIGTNIIIWDQDTHLKEVVLHVSSVPSYAAILLFVGALATGGAVYIIYKSRKKAERPVVYSFRKAASGIKKAVGAEPAAIEKEVKAVEKLRTEVMRDVKEDVKSEVMKKLKKHLAEEMEGSVIEKQRE